MTDTYGTTGRHPGLAIAWASEDSIMVEFPTKNGPPYITRYPKTINGLAAALNVLIQTTAPRVTTVPPNHPAISRRSAVTASAEALEVIRKMLK